MKSIAIGAAALCLVAAPASAQDSPAAPSTAARSVGPTLELRGGRWFTGERFAPARWYVVDGRFTARRPQRVDAVIDFRDSYVLPPLAEAHNHNLQSGFTAAMMAPRYLASGIFYTLQLGSNAEEVMPFRNLLRGPGSVDAAFADTLLSASDGHPLALALDGAKGAGMTISADDVRDKMYTVVDSPADLAAKWPAIAASGVELVKVILIDSARYRERHGDPKHFGRNGIDPALLPDIVARAKAAGARVAAHVDTGQDAAVAVAAGVDIIAHLPGYRIDAPLTIADYRLDDATIAAAARAKITWITTIAASRYYLKARLADREALMANHRDNLARLIAGGVTVAPGSDLFDGSVIDEIEAIDALGTVPRATLVHMATHDAARAVFPDRRIGCLCEGAEASLIAVEGDPLRDLSALRRVRMAIKQGELLAR